MNAAGVALRNAQCQKVVQDLLSKTSNVEMLRIEAEKNMLPAKDLEGKLIQMLITSPTVPLDIDHFFLSGLLGKALAWKADSITYKQERGAYTALFYRNTPQWLRWLIPFYPWGGTKVYVSTLRTTIKLDQ